MFYLDNKKLNSENHNKFWKFLISFAYYMIFMMSYSYISDNKEFEDLMNIMKKITYQSGKPRTIIYNVNLVQ